MHTLISVSVKFLMPHSYLWDNTIISALGHCFSLPPVVLGISGIVVVWRAFLVGPLKWQKMKIDKREMRVQKGQWNSSGSLSPESETREHRSHFSSGTKSTKYFICLRWKLEAFWMILVNFWGLMFPMLCFLNTCALIGDIKIENGGINIE